MHKRQLQVIDMAVSSLNVDKIIENMDLVGAHLGELRTLFGWWTMLKDAERKYAAWFYRKMTARGPGLGAKIEAHWKQSYETTDRLAAFLAELPR